MQMRPEVVFFYCLQIAMVGIPLVLVAFLARTIGTTGLGLFAIAQAFATVLSVIVDYGLSFTGTREVAKVRDNPDALARAVGPVLTAKAILSFAALGVSGVTYLLSPVFQANPVIFGFTVAYGILMGHNFYWFFGGIQRYMLSGGLDLCARLGGLTLILLLVHSPDDTWKVIAGLTASQFAVSVAAVMLIVMRHIVPRDTGLVHGLRQIRRASNLFVPHLLGTIMVNANAMLLGWLASIHQTGLYSGAERIMRGASLPFYPLRQTLFPLFVDAQQRDKPAARRMFSTILATVAGVGATIALLLAAGAEPIVRYGLGKGFSESVIVLIILAPVPLFNALSEVFGSCWLIPRAHDSLCRTISIITFVTHLGVTAFLVSAFQSRGMAGAVLFSNAFSCLLMGAAVLWYRGRGEEIAKQSPHQSETLDSNL